MVSTLEALKVPGIVLAIVLVIVVVASLFKDGGTIVDGAKRLFNWFKTIKQKIVAKQQEKKRIKQALASVEKLLTDINQHYSKDNITKRDNWIAWVNSQADLYNTNLADINEKLENLSSKIEKTAALAEETNLDQKRNAVLEFSLRVNNPRYDYSREHFKKIFKTIREYEQYIEENNLINGEIDHAIEVIEKAYEEKKNSDKIVW